MENITVKDIVAATGGRLLCGNAAQKIEHLSIDSRTMKGNDLFVPLIGEKVDAHRFVETGIQQLTAELLVSLALLYNVSIDYLLCQTDNPNRY